MEDNDSERKCIINNDTILITINKTDSVVMILIINNIINDNIVFTIIEN